MLKGLKYALRQRLNVPGTVDTIGVVMRRTESVAEQPNYKLRWLSNSGREQSGWFAESEVAAVNGVPAAAAPQAANLQLDRKGGRKRRRR